MEKLERAGLWKHMEKLRVQRLWEGNIKVS